MHIYLVAEQPGRQAKGPFRRRSPSRAKRREGAWKEPTAPDHPDLCAGLETAGKSTSILNDVAYEIRSAKIYIEPIDFDADAQSIKDVSGLVLGLVHDPGQLLVDRARETVVRLREIVLGQRAGLPRAVWQQLDALAFGG